MNSLFPLLSLLSQFRSNYDFGGNLSPNFVAVLSCLGLVPLRTPNPADNDDNNDDDDGSDNHNDRNSSRCAR